MKKVKLIPAAVLCLALCTGCKTIPQPDPSEEIPERTSATEAETDADTTASDKKTSESSKNTKWKDAYRKLLERRYRKSEHEDSYFALIQLDDDTIPELVILDGIEMELYCYQNGTTEMLLEDAYNSSAIADQNVCYQPEKSLFSTAFSTMGAGSGFTIFSYPELDAVNAERFYFDNNENTDGEMPYNHIWDRAEEFEVTDNGYHDVSLGESWVHIGEDFKDIWELTEENIEDVGKGWKPLSDRPDDEDDDDDDDDDDDEEETEDTEDTEDTTEDEGLF